MGLDQGLPFLLSFCFFLILNLCFFLKGWFDEGTRNKIHVLGKEPGPTLLELINGNDLPKVYGGQLDWRYEDEPILDDAARELIGEMPKGPAIFENNRVERPVKEEPETSNKGS